MSCLLVGVTQKPSLPPLIPPTSGGDVYSLSYIGEGWGEVLHKS